MLCADGQAWISLSRGLIPLHSQTDAAALDGELTSWTPFWDSFRAGARVHDNDSLSDLYKFNYMHGLLQCTALKAISGLSLTSGNGCKAVTILGQRFGNKSQFAARHMDILIHVEAVTLTFHLISRDSVIFITGWNQTSEVSLLKFSSQKFVKILN